MSEAPTTAAAENGGPGGTRERRRFVAPVLEQPETVDRRAYIWHRAIGIWGIHLLALLALLPALFSWTNVAVAVVGVFLFGQGVNCGYHRLLTHRSFRVPRWYEYFLVVLALCCLQDTPVTWVTHHRAHHRFSDRRADPHSPFAGFYWGHMGWLFWHNREVQGAVAFDRYARDVLDDRFYRALERNGWSWNLVYLLHGALFFVAGAGVGYIASGDLTEAYLAGAGLLVWGVFLRTVLVWHITWSVNSLAHVFGRRTWYTREGSTNNTLVGLVAAGEGWHNNHHQDETSARHGFLWWELDLTWWHIHLLEIIGLAREVNRPRRRTPAVPAPGDDAAG